MSALLQAELSFDVQTVEAPGRVVKLPTRRSAPPQQQGEQIDISLPFTRGTAGIATQEAQPQQQADENLLFVPIPTDILRRSDLSVFDAVIYGRLFVFGRDNGQCTASYQTIADELGGISTRTVMRSVEKLEALGLIACKRRKDDFNTTLIRILGHDWGEFWAQESPCDSKSHHDNPGVTLCQSWCDSKSHEVHESELKESKAVQSTTEVLDESVTRHNALSNEKIDKTQTPKPRGAMHDPDRDGATHAPDIPDGQKWKYTIDGKRRDEGIATPDQADKHMQKLGKMLGIK